MKRSRLLGSLAVLALGCNLGLDSLDSKPPPVPDDYPRPDEYEDAKAELLIDGENYVTEHGIASFNAEGGFDDQFRASLSLDDVDLDFRDIEVGTYTVAENDLTASYIDLTASDIEYAADGTCGEGSIEVIERKRYDSGLSGEREVIWGTIQLELCNDDANVIEISGRYSAIMDDR